MGTHAYRIAVIPIVAALLAAAVPANAKWTEDPWAAAARKPGVKIVVMGVDGRVQRGVMAEWSPEAVAVQTPAGRVDIARESVAIIRAAGPLGDFHTVYAPWTNLSHLSRGQRIRVIRTNWTQVDGALVESGEDGVTLQRRQKTVFVPRDRIRKVRILVKSNAEKGFAVGATVGFVAALAMLVGAASQGGSIEDAETIVEGAGFGAGKAGEALASLFDQYQTVYLSPRK